MLAFVNKNVSVTLSPYLISKTEVTQNVWQRMMGNNPSYFKGDDHPVEQVSWQNCQEFCKKTGLRLLTEEQWEYASRGGSKTKWYSGDDENQLNQYAWYNESDTNGHHPVAQKKPNAFGLYDMAGNVWEWCEDYYSIYLKVSEDTRRVLRGGCWYNNSAYLRSAKRSKDVPNRVDYNSYGFRVGISIK